MKKFILLLVAMLAALYCTAQELPIRQAWMLGWDGAQVRTTDNCVITLWEDTNAGDTDIYAQKLNSSGVTQWANPVIVAGGAGVQEVVACEKTSDNNFILLYQQSGYGFQPGFWAQKFSSNGQRLWGETGVPIYNGGIHLLSAFIVPNTGGGAYIVYDNFYSQNTVVGQNLDSYGNQLWVSGGVVLASHSAHLKLDGVVSDGEGGIIINVHKQIGSTYYAELTRYSSNGAVVGNNPILAPSASLGSSYSILRDAQGRFVLWSVIKTPNSYLKLLCIDNAGNFLIPAPLTFNISFCADELNKASLMAVSDGGLMLSYESDPLQERKLMLARLSSSYEMMWGNSGVQIATTEAFVWFKLTASVTESGGAWLSWMENPTDGFNRILKAQYVSPAGVALWGTSGMVVAEPNWQIDNLKPISFADKGLFLWHHKKDMQNSVRRQVFTTAGGALFAAEGAPLVSRLAGFAELLDTIAIQDKYLVFWQDNRNGWYNVYYQLYDAAMNPLLEPQGRCFGQPAEIYMYQWKILKMADNSVVVLSRMCPEQGYAYDFMQRIDANGNLMYPGEGIQVADNPHNYVGFSSCGEDIYLGWIEGLYDGMRIMGQRISNGQAVWGASGKTLLASNDGEYLILISVQDRYYTYIKQVIETNERFSYVLKVDDNGDPETGWSPDGILLDSGLYNDYSSPEISTMLGNDLVVFSRSMADYTWSAQRINSLGTKLWGDEGITLPDVSDIQDLFTDDGISFVFTAGSDPQELRLQKIDGDGNLLYGENGNLVASGLRYSYDANLVKYGSGAMACIWSSYGPDANGYEDVYIRHINPLGQPLGTAPTVLCNAWLEQVYVHAAVIGNSALVTWNDARAGILDSENFVSSIYGTMINSSPVSIADPMAPAVNTPVLGANYPNPFNPETTIAFSLPVSGEAGISIFNIKGQKVRNLVPHTLLPAGEHSVVWNGCDDNGKPLSSGVYFYTLTSGTSKTTRKMLLMK